MKINNFVVVFLVFIINCSIFTLEHTNPNDPSNIEEQEIAQFPDYEKLQIGKRISNILTYPNNTSKKYYYKFNGSEDISIYVKNNYYDYKYYYSIYVYDENENYVTGVPEQGYSKTIYINESDFTGDYMIIEIDIGTYTSFNYGIEIYLN